MTRLRIGSVCCFLTALLLSLLTGCGGNQEAPQAPAPEIVARWKGAVLEKDVFLSRFAKANYREVVQYLEQEGLNAIMALEAAETGVGFTHAELADYVQKLEEAYGPGGLQDYLSSSGLTHSDWLNQAKADLTRAKLIEINVTEMVKVGEDELRPYFDEHSSEFEEPKRVRARQILVKNEETARQILRLLNQKRKGFESLAREHSVAPEAAEGGDLGWVKKGDLPEELEGPIFKLDEGKYSKVVETSYGYHIFSVDEIRQPGLPEFDEVKDEVREALFERKAEIQYDKWISELKEKWKLQTFPDDIL